MAAAESPINGAGKIAAAKGASAGAVLMCPLVGAVGAVSVRRSSFFFALVAADRLEELSGFRVRGDT